jgi:RNA 3'-terminal phosphate cyclase (ATP)
MIIIDGSEKSGSGTIIRDAVSFSVLSGKPVRATHIRAKRDKPGLRPQHLKALEAAAEVCGGRLKGAAVGAREIVFSPGQKIRGGTYDWNIGSAGSAVMLVFCLLPVALFADGPSLYTVTGGLFQDFAPSALHLKHVVLPILRRMGIRIRFDILQPGYVPKGGGRIRVEVEPVVGGIAALTLRAAEPPVRVKGIALSSHLTERKVSQRMADASRQRLRLLGYEAQIDIRDDTREHPVFESAAKQRGASLLLWAETPAGCLFGSDMAGTPKRSAEFIGEKTAENLVADISSNASVDRFTADQLIPFAALAGGESSYRVPLLTDHIESRLWLAEAFFGARSDITDRTVRLEGIGRKQHPANLISTKGSQ